MCLVGDFCGGMFGVGVVVMVLGCRCSSILFLCMVLLVENNSLMIMLFVGVISLCFIFIVFSISSGLLWCSVWLG